MGVSSEEAPAYQDEQNLNASGHPQELSRNFSLVSLAGVGLVVGSVWPAAGGSIVVALYNGGPPGGLLNSRSSMFTDIEQAFCTNSSLYPSFIGLSQLL
jgi:hypothetical protein